MTTPARSRRSRASAVLMLMLTAASLGWAAGGCHGRVLDTAQWHDSGPIVPGNKLSFTESFPSHMPTALDVLFVLDNSPGMGAFLDQMPDASRAFLAVLRSQPNGPADLHVAVTTTDMGMGRITEGGAPGCNNLPVGTDGMLQNGPAHPLVWNDAAWAWTTAADVPCPGAAAYLAQPAVTSTGNFQGTLEDALACLVQPGIGGCIFTQPLRSALRAISRNQDGFLRPDAQLAVVIVSHADDCSLPANSMLLDPSSTNLDSALGPLTTYRCNVYGHVCDGEPPPRRPSDMTSWPYYPTSCTASDQPELTLLGDVIDQLHKAKRATSMVSLSVIAGPATSSTGASRYSVAPDRKQAEAAGFPDQEWPKVQPSCGVTRGGTADPSVRLQQLTDMLGASGSFDGICGASLIPQLEAVARFIVTNQTNHCLSDDDHQKSLVERLDSGDEIGLPRCDEDAGTQPCWGETSEPSCKNGVKLVVNGTLEPGILVLR